MPILRKLFDWLIFPLLIIWLVFEPHFNYGTIDYLESGQYLSVIHGLWQGQMLYRDLFILFGPLSYLGPMVFMAFFGTTLAVLRAYFMTANIMNFLLIYVLCRILIRHRFLSYLACFFAVVEGHQPFWSVRWGGFRLTSALLFLIALTFYLRTRRKLFLLLSGVFATAGFLHSLDVGVLCTLAAFIFFCMEWFTSNKEDGKRNFLSQLGIYGVGVVITLVPFFLWLGAQGAWGAFLRDFFSLGSRSVWAQPLRWEYCRMETLIYISGLYVLAFIFFIRTWFGKLDVRQTIKPIVVLSVYGTAAYLFSFRAIAGPQFESALPFVILTGFAILDTLDLAGDSSIVLMRSSGRFGKRRVIGLVFLTMMVVFHLFSIKRFYFGNIFSWFSYQTHKRQVIPVYLGMIEKEKLNSRAVNLNITGLKGSQVPDFQAQEIEEIVSYVRSHSAADDILFAFPELGIFNFLCDRPGLDRFTISGFAWGKPQWEAELLEDLERKKPRLVLTKNDLSNLAQSITRTEEILPDVQKFILDHYEIVHRTERLNIYRRKVN